MLQKIVKVSSKALRFPSGGLFKGCPLMVLLLLSGYKPHLALLGWYNAGRVYY